MVPYVTASHTCLKYLHAMLKHALLLLVAVLPVWLPAQSPVYIVTTGKLPQLAYSTGEDRLGGAKMGYIDTGIVLKVVDSMNNLYHVQLSKNHTAYIEKNYTAFTAPVAGVPAIAESWSVRGEGEKDIASIALTKKVAYKSWMDIDPARIQLELYNVQSNTNWITQLRSIREVKNVWYEQAEDDVLRITIELKHKQHWGYHIGFVRNSLQLHIRHLPAKARLKNMTIAIDAGHGGTNTGASGINTKSLEKNYTILFAQALQQQLLKKHATVLMVRDKDTTIDNKDRVLWSIARNPDLFVSFHLNSSSRSTARGVSTYYKHVSYRAFTEAILGRLLYIGDLQEFGNIGSFNFQPIQPTEFPSCLVEVAFLSNPGDEQMILDETFQKKVAKQVRRGIKDFLKHLK